jgi:penicillin-binding protein 1B
MSAQTEKPVNKRRKSGRFLTSTLGRIFAVLVSCGFVVTLVAAIAVWSHYSRLIDEKLSAGPFPNTSMLFAAPRPVLVGDELTAEEVLGILRRSGYGESRSNRTGWYNVRADALEVFPGPDSYFDQEAGVIKFAEGKVRQIISLRDNTERTQYLLEPELITNLFDRKREKRRLVRFSEIPKVLVNAVVSAEDKRFFQHAGFDPLRIVKAAYVDVRTGQRAQGASTLSMQLARGFWLTLEKTWKRKTEETIITLLLEQKLTKEEIFEYYANSVDLGRRGSFNIRGFGEAATAYFGKDVRQLSLPEAATLAGLIQRPSSTNPFRWPERAKQRRNIILQMMLENGYISEKQYVEAASTPLTVTRGGADSTDAPYFVDLVNDELQDRFEGHDFQESSYRIYTTLDLNLQREAVEAVRYGLAEVDDQVRRRKIHPGVDAQVALVALDAETAEVKALVGGRNYGVSQLNRVLAKRQPGSVFKPFVYAAAVNTALAGEDGKTFTTVSTLVDEPTTFWYDGKPYEPNNYKSEFHGTVTLRQAIAKSMNIPTVKLAEAIGYETVVELARAAGMNLQILATPAVALGAYEVTPLEVAGAYTIFPGQGTYVQPNFLKMIRDDKGRIIYEYKPVRRQVLDARTAYLMVDLLGEVMRSGTAAGARSRGFVLPAAGKTGTSHDGWLAGFTSKLLCVVWVGFDDNQELKLEGARSALPVWTEFMKRAHQYREYRRVRPFQAPEGVVSLMVDSMSGEIATPSCPAPRAEVFIAGTQPVAMCHLHGGGRPVTHVAGWEPPGVPSEESTPRKVAEMRAPRKPSKPVEIAVQPPKEQPKADKRGFFGRIRDLFR